MMNLLNPTIFSGTWLNYHEKPSTMNWNLKSVLCYIALGYLLFLPKSLFGHALEESYIFFSIHQDRIEGEFQIRTEDLNTALGLNLSKDLTLEDLGPYLGTIRAYILQRVKFSAGQENYTIKFTESELHPLKIGTFAKFLFQLEGVKEVPDYLNIDYNILFDKNRNHRGIIIQNYNWEAGIINNEGLISLILTPNNNRQELPLKEGSILNGFWAMIKLGIWHIWIGLDHILFLLALILPSVVRRKTTEGEKLTLLQAIQNWKAVDKFKPAFFYILKIITFFTIAHSITLALAALNIINLPSRLVESIIALSIALAAAHNIYPIFKAKEWVIAFVFGLFHGFGFASVLAEKGLSGEYMVLSLLGFNVGVEIGQVLIICMIFPVLFLLRRWKIYPQLLVYGSILLILISFYWATERIFDIELQWGAVFKSLFRSIGLIS